MIINNFIASGEDTPVHTSIKFIKSRLVVVISTTFSIIFSFYFVLFCFVIKWKCDMFTHTSTH